MEMNYTAVIVMSIMQFIVGAVWYTFLGKIWGEIHGFDKLPKEVQQKMMKEMGPLYGTQFIVTLVTSYVLVMLAMNMPESMSLYRLAFLAWLGFIVPTQISGVIFGGTENKWVAKKILIQAGASFVCLMVAAATMSYML